MSTLLLEEAQLKLLRGREHFKSLYNEIGRFWDTEPYAVVHEYDAEHSRNLLRFKMLRPIPQHAWGLIVGDAVHNARTALDFIAWRLAGSDLSDIYSQFPICKTPESWTNFQWHYKRKPIHRDALAYIAALQPHVRPNPEETVLWMLQELEARDKHKLINMTESASAGFGVFVNDPIPVTIPYDAVEGRIKHDTILAESPGPPRQMNMEFEFAFRVIFERGIFSAVAEFDIGKSLEQIFEAVEVIITKFERFIAANPSWIPT